MHATMVWKSEDSLQELILFFQHVGSMDQIQIGQVGLSAFIDEPTQWLKNLHFFKKKPPRWAYTHWCVGANILGIWCNEEMFLKVCTEIRAALKSGWNGRRERQTDHILEQGEWRWASKYGAEEQFRKLETFCFSGIQSISQVKVITRSAGCQGKIRTHGWGTKWL